MNIKEIKNEELLGEFAAEVDGNTRRISTDPPSIERELYAEIIQRMKANHG